MTLNKYKPTRPSAAPIIIIPVGGLRTIGQVSISRGAPKYPPIPQASFNVLGNGVVQGLGINIIGNEYDEGRDEESNMLRLKPWERHGGVLKTVDEKKESSNREGKKFMTDKTFLPQNATNNIDSLLITTRKHANTALRQLINLDVWSVD
jgi:hypothetical protein